jgi:RNA polymerase sigma-70 factor (ECF subfamily)
MNLDELNKAIKKAGRGDTKYFRLIVEEFQSFVYAIAFRTLGDESTAKDLTQDVFISVWENIASFNKNLSFKTWLYRVTLNKGVDMIRKLGSQKKYLDYSFDRFKDGNSQDPWELYSDKELIGILLTLVDALSEKQRMVFRLKDIEGLDSGEICAALDLSPDQVKSNLYHARKRLRKELQLILTYREEKI